MSERSKNSLAERLADREEMSRAVTQVVQEAIRRHKEMGKSIAVWGDGSVVIVPAEQITLSQDIQTEPDFPVRELAQNSAK